MNNEDRIRRLEDLHFRGRLSDEELVRARAALSSGTPLDERVSELLLSDEVERLDREWERERERYMVRFKQTRFVPTKSTSIAMGFLMVVVGLFWTIGVSSMGAGFNADFGSWPRFGIMFIVAWLAFCTYSYSRAAKYEQAFEAHQGRREKLIADYLDDLPRGETGAQGAATEPDQ